MKQRVKRVSVEESNNFLDERHGQTHLFAFARDARRPVRR